METSKRSVIQLTMLHVVLLPRSLLKVQDGSQEFLWMPKDQWPQPLEDRELVSLPDDPEVKKVTSYATSTQEPWSLVESLSYFSDWQRACRAIAICLRYKQKL